MEFKLVTVKSKLAISIRDHSTAAELSNKFAELYGELSGLMKKQSLDFDASLFGIYHGFSPEDVDVEAGIPVSGSPEPEGRMNIINTYEGKAVKLDFHGPYSSLSVGWNAMIKYIEDNNLKASAPCFEVYVTDPGSEPDSNKWHTEIYYPIL